MRKGAAVHPFAAPYQSAPAAAVKSAKPTVQAISGAGRLEVRARLAHTAVHTAATTAASAAGLVETGAGQAEVAKQLGLKPYPAQKLVAQARQFELSELSGAIIRLADLDLAVKGASRLDSRFELELALADIAGE